MIYFITVGFCLLTSCNRESREVEFELNQPYAVINCEDQSYGELLFQDSLITSEDLAFGELRPHVYRIGREGHLIVEGDTSEWFMIKDGVLSSIHETVHVSPVEDIMEIVDWTPINEKINPMLLKTHYGLEYFCE